MPEVKHSSEIESGAVADIAKAIEALRLVSSNLCDNTLDLQDTLLWAGSAHDICSDANRAIGAYKSAIEPVCGQLKTILEELNTNVDNFKQ